MILILAFRLMLMGYVTTVATLITQSYRTGITQKEMKLLLHRFQKNKKSAKNREFDCIIGLSGGLDSSYAAHVVVKKMGLKPLLLHVDAGWNTEVAVSNIERSSMV